MMKHVDAVIVGGGPAGLAAAIELRRKGIDDILILEREKKPGGILRQCIHDGFGLTRFGETLSGPEYAARFVREAEELDIPCLTDTTVLVITPDRHVYASSSEHGMMEFEAGAIILAMGCRERTRGAISIPGTRPAGVYTAGVAQAYINLKNKMVGRRVVILGSGDIGMIMARRMTLEGAEVLGVFEVQPYASGLPRNVEQCLNDYGIPLSLSHTVTDIRGTDRLEGVVISQVDDHMQPIPGTEREYACDTLILSVGLIPENELTWTAGAEKDPGTSGPAVDENYQTTVPGIFAAGNVLHRRAPPGQHGRQAPPHAQGAARRDDPDQAQRRRPQSDRRPGGEGVMLREFTCIMCPQRCDISVELEEGAVVGVSGNRCPKGEAYVRQEIENPMRNIATSVRVDGGELPLASVRLSGVIPKARIFDVMAEIRKVELDAPVHEGDVAIHDALGLGVDVIVTKDVEVA